MKLPNNPLTEAEFREALNALLAECGQADGHQVHKKCGGAVRRGFYNCFAVTPGGSLDPGFDGFGLGPREVPYCEKCDPPDGFNHTYAVRVGIITERRPD